MRYSATFAKAFKMVSWVFKPPAEEGYGTMEGLAESPVMDAGSIHTLLPSRSVK